MVGVLACLLIGTVLISLSLQSALRGRREARLERQLAQTEWLCEGGAIRAVAALQKSADYQGETWQPKLRLEPFTDAVVDIKVARQSLANIAGEVAKEKTDESKIEPATSNAWTILVVARLDSTTDIDGPMQRSLSLTVKQSKEANTNSEKSQ